MKQGANSCRAFTLLEVLAVMAIVVLLAGMMLPAIGRTQASARRVQCLSNLRQTGLGFHLFLHDHGDNFPMQISASQGGTSEAVISAYLGGGQFSFSFAHFQALSNDLATPRIFACPADPKRSPADDFAALNNRHLSYFVGVNADYQLPNSLLAGDRNLVSHNSATTRRDRAVLRLDDSTPANWTRELHGCKGNALFADAHVERVNTVLLKLPRRNAPLVMDLILPSVQPTRSAPAALASATWTTTVPRMSTENFQ